MIMGGRRRLLVLVAVLAAGCAVRPVRFADAPAIEAVSDDTPVPMPRVFEPVHEFRLSEAYLRRPIVNALDPERAPEGGDVNALDEVPRSTWISAPNASPPEDVLDPPVPPLHPLPKMAAVSAEALRVIDARGRTFEVWRDPADRPEMSTAAAATASVLMRALGYHATGAWARDVTASDFTAVNAADREALKKLFDAGPKPVNGRYRVGFVRWPIGVDLGPTHALDRRADDGNDRVPHLDRRSLRALGPVFEWLGVSRLGSGVLRDAYTGKPGKGHVVHWVVDLSGALGADAVVRPERPRDDDADLAGRNIWVTMGTLGIYAPEVTPTQTRWPSIGEFPPTLARTPFQTSPPLEPIDRMRPSDGYWIGKRIEAIPHDTIVAALTAGRFSDGTAHARLGELLEARRNAVVRRAFAAVTPAEVDRIDATALVLRDEAIARGVSRAVTRYRIEIVDDHGQRVVDVADVPAEGARVVIPLPAKAPSYLVLRATAVRDGRAAPRAMEAHLLLRDGGWRVVGVRH
ncbi:Hypothetical protein A7982_01715 [Minicystis rosea]|nr:Hypothetical protein A7982_01715 [Minicystis rosea]